MTAGVGLSENNSARLLQTFTLGANLQLEEVRLDMSCSEDAILRIQLYQVPLVDGKPDFANPTYMATSQASMRQRTIHKSFKLPQQLQAGAIFAIFPEPLSGVDGCSWYHDNQNLFSGGEAYRRESSDGTWIEQKYDFAFRLLGRAATAAGL